MLNKGRKNKDETYKNYLILKKKEYNAVNFFAEADDNILRG